MIESLVKQTYDNVTVVMLAFAGFKEALKREEDARIIKEIEMEKENVKEREREKPKEPLDFYLAYDKRPKAKRSASNPRAKISFNYNQRESQESIETEKSTTNSSVDEALSVNRFKQKLSPFVGEPTLKDKNYSASKHLVKAYKKMNFFPLVK